MAGQAASGVIGLKTLGQNTESENINDWIARLKASGFNVKVAPFINSGTKMFFASLGLTVLFLVTLGLVIAAFQYLMK